MSREKINMTCTNCHAWFEVKTDRYGSDFNFCPCCGYEFTVEDFEAMDLEDERDE